MAPELRHQHQLQPVRQSYVHTTNRFADAQKAQAEQSTTVSQSAVSLLIYQFNIVNIQSSSNYALHKITLVTRRKYTMNVRYR